ncbi:MAG: glycosyltransferase family 4 protein [Candidatus Eisenbacteria bacterium]|uniref:Glycosyltransferase family 4 protein n=1 Tax=Eiseniibacteriota bacterium TaxID=2212470 RepID=A0A948RX81_UNCEI|nr:glycosyltransferase family 4 protein [Candidatus Eisenbacteria bacterium]MBU1947565.1 glycosyltransferase family 4 protein [Candidatus Eisenbacteria bacterium]MBU2692705.1 glycosyltransferase family 4 protein [Candidatus Eisenbacteria bacterium]
MRRPIKIDFLAWRPISNASARCRGAAYKQAFGEMGYELNFRPPAPDGIYRFLNSRRGLMRIPAKILYFVIVLIMRKIQILRASRADAVVVQRELFTFGPPFLERILAYLQPNLIYDIDDAVDMTPPHIRSSGRRFHDQRKPEKILSLCRHLVASTHFLAERFQRERIPTTIIPTPVDTELFQPSGPSARGNPALGWIGTGGNLYYLKQISDALVSVQREYGCEVVVVSEWDFQAPGLEVRNLRWRMEDEVELMSRFDIGLMPLVDNPYTRAKAGYKILQYWATGKAVIASPVGFNRILVHHDINGLLANTMDEWTFQLGRLIRDRDLRARLSAAGRQRVEDEYSIERCAVKWDEVFKRLLKS